MLVIIANLILPLARANGRHGLGVLARALELHLGGSAGTRSALEDAFLKRSGADLSTFRPEPGAPPSWKMGPLPFFKIGGLDISDYGVGGGNTDQPVGEHLRATDLSGFFYQGF